MSKKKKYNKIDNTNSSIALEEKKEQALENNNNSDSKVEIKNELYIESTTSQKEETSISRTPDIEIINDETYFYEFIYFENTGQIKEAGGDGYLANIVGIGKYSDAYEALDNIDAYIKNNGGTCKKSEVEEVK